MGVHCAGVRKPVSRAAKRQPAWTNVTVTLGQLKAWAQNPKLSTKAQAKRLLDSFEKFGQVMTVAIDPDYNVLDGHQRLSALLTIHGADYKIDARQSDRDLTDEERAELVVTLHAGAVGSWDWNKLSGWDAGQLQSWGMDSDALKGWGNDVSNLKELLDAEKPDDADAEPQIDRAAELQEKWQTATGQLWAIGAHRLLCGDSTSAEDVGRVMGGEKAGFSFTDPPYNVGVSYTKETDDSKGRLDFIEWCKSWAKFLPQKLCMTVGVKRLLWWRDILGDPQWTIAWVKMNGQSNTGLGGTNKWDPILIYGCRPDNQIDLIEINNDYSEKLVSGGDHPTPKPVELWIKVIERFCEVSEIVFEPFTGTGTTLLACQNLSRKCRAIEISPAYCAVILERMISAFPDLDIHLIE